MSLLAKDEPASAERAMAKPVHPGMRLTPAVALRLGRIFVAQRQRRGLRKNQCHPELSAFEVTTLEKARLRYMTDKKADAIGQFLGLSPGLLPILLDHPTSRIVLSAPGLSACHIIPIAPACRQQLADRMVRHQAHLKISRLHFARSIGIGDALLRDLMRASRHTLRGDTVSKLAVALLVDVPMMLRWLGAKPEDHLDPHS